MYAHQLERLAQDLWVLKTRRSHYKCYSGNQWIKEREREKEGVGDLPNDDADWLASGEEMLRWGIVLEKMERPVLCDKFASAMLP